jgi:hypothetical protein
MIRLRSRQLSIVALFGASVIGGLATALLSQKFHLQRPTQRTIEQLRLLGVNLAPGTITDGMKRIEPLLEPIDAALRTRQQQSTYFHADETRWKVPQSHLGIDAQGTLSVDRYSGYKAMHQVKAGKLQLAFC